MSIDFNLISSLLQAVVHSGNKEAEQRLHEFEGLPGYGPVLCMLALGGGDGAGVPRLPDDALRQLALVLLKQLIQSRWDDSAAAETAARRGPGGAGPSPAVGAISPADRDAIKQRLPAGLSDPAAAIRSAAGVAVAAVAHFDWPERWPGLLEDILRAARADDALLRDGAIRCLDMFASGENLDSQFLQPVCQALLPEMLAVFGSAGALDDETRARAARIYQSSLTWLTEAPPALVGQLLRPTVNSWLQSFGAELGRAAQMVAAAASSNSAPPALPAALAALKAATVLAEHHRAAALRRRSRALLEPVWQFLQAVLPAYERWVVADSSEATTDSDGLEVGLERVVLAALELVRVSIERSGPMARFARRRLALTTQFLMGYSQATADQVEEWDSDPNEFVASNDDTFSWNTRLSARYAISLLVEKFGDKAITALVNSSGPAFASVAHYVSNIQHTNQHGWQAGEAAFGVLASLGDELVLRIRAAAHPVTPCPLPFDVGAFLGALFQSLETALSSGAASPYLRGGALACFAAFAPVAPVHALAPFVQFSAGALQQGGDAGAGESLPVKVCACRALYKLCPRMRLAAQGISPGSPAASAAQSHATPEQLKVAVTEAAPTMITGVCALLPEAAGETLQLLVDTLGAVLRVDPQATANYGPKVLPYVQRVWISHANDRSLVASCEELFSACASEPTALAGTVEAMLNPLRTLIGSPNRTSELSGLLASALDVLTDLINAHGDRLASAASQNGGSGSAALLTELLPMVLRIMRSTDDAAVMQAGACTLTAYVRCAAPALATLPADGGGGGGGGGGEETALQAIVAVTARLLDVSLDDRGAAYVGPLVSKLIGAPALAPHLANELQAILQATFTRLTLAKLPSVVQQLVLVFARLVHSHPDDVIRLLSALDAGGASALGPGGPPAGNGLAYVLGVWCKNHREFLGAFQTKLSAMALAKLAASGEPLQSIAVPGELIVAPVGEQNQANGRRTGRRSARLAARARNAKSTADQWTWVPLLAKVATLLVGEYDDLLLQEESAKLALNGVDDDDDDDDDDDEAGGNGINGDGTGEDDDDDDDDDDDEDDKIGSLAAAQDDEQAAFLAATGASSAASAKGTILLSDLFDELHDTDDLDHEAEEQDDPDIVRHPLYSVEFRPWIVSYFKSLNGDQMSALSQCASFFNQKQQQRIQQFLS